MEAVPQTQQAAQTLLGTPSSDATHAMDDAQAQVAADKVIEESRKIVKDNHVELDEGEEAFLQAQLLAIELGIANTPVVTNMNARRFMVRQLEKGINYELTKQFSGRPGGQGGRTRHSDKGGESFMNCVVGRR